MPSLNNRTVPVGVENTPPLSGPVGGSGVVTSTRPSSSSRAATAVAATSYQHDRGGDQRRNVASTKLRRGVRHRCRWVCPVAVLAAQMILERFAVALELVLDVKHEL